MASIEVFEDLEAWKKARFLAKTIYHITTTGAFSRDFGLCSQIQRAAVSVMSNIAEGFERNGNKEFKQFLYLAKGSLGEVKSQLYLVFDVGFITQEQFTALKPHIDETGRLIGGLIRYLGNTDFKGRKFTD